MLKKPLPNFPAVARSNLLPCLHLFVADDVSHSNVPVLM
jgi:hypothetical protein